ncbi:MAG: AmmeMemoRadiSam system protein B [Candidatus Nanoarchaeia archaeon]|nr:AmmeMemoRadiSam system protein B [Candidatus Nanoarchaeia archaeon]
MIKPIVAGQFYPAGKEALIKLLDKCFSSAKDAKKAGSKAFGIIAPHAGYAYSGNAAAVSYNAIRGAKTFVILAPDHNGLCFSPTTTKEDFETPLGIVRTDTELVEKLKAKCSFLKTGRIQEHAVEVQLPFLQYLFKEFRIVPIVIPSSEYYKELGKAIASLGKDSIIICSSDFTHYGASYGFMPFDEKNAKAGMNKLDSGAIKFIERLDAGGFLKYVQETGATICGEYAIATAIEAVKAMEAKKGVLLNYYTSGDISEDYSLAVGYASVAFV